ncbi:delta-aminolevulinic acid dehydratase (porphobilinogen synthase) [Chondrus crispus]|uniref:Delta-aminolevulinic acid dehydratase n=1 Tax=Chondrus crispus TaxID=2769 RepID=R7QA57_CHOCR|nr:delta-aminolevulinic acid dehydratase (porphobilinogen synthase) [Chondrus crispus]CDF34658.1 delta-aminolevulinic acid dehydratase (porphobilinogen synthase) [Chondrus crispus]|eukprot:XP_005714477.1 delta-aminolevulinic acid dehydratase (porphobilinogen synthase) [Chondrus crispus]
MQAFVTGPFAKQSPFLGGNVTSSTGKSSRRPDRALTTLRATVTGNRLAEGPVPGLRVNDEGKIWVPQRARPRRNRKTEGLRSMVRENSVSPSNFIYPLFIHTKDYNEEISAMPGCERHSLESVLKEVGEAEALGVKSVILFPKIPEDVKTNAAEECYNPNGLIPKAISAIKSRYPNVAVWTDVALDPYSDQGHDGMVSADNRGDGGMGRILNDETVEQLCRQAVCQARAGADVVAPSDMMDGRVGAIRDALDSYGFTDVSLVSYTAKYASAFYGPFRDALDSAPRESSNAPPNKKTYQMDPANSREALIEAALDVAEGADMLMVKPGMPYLDIIHRLKAATNLPISAYHVSGEYAMMKAAAQRGWLDERESVLESLLCFRRAGADAILTYYAKQAAQWMHES